MLRINPLDPLTEKDDSNNAPIEFPSIGADAYRTDDEFCNIYTYLESDELTGNARKVKTTLLMSDRFVIENDLLYRIDTPRQKRLAQLRPVVKRLCIPKRYRHDIMRFVHNNCGHYAVQSMYHTLFVRYYWKSLFADAAEYCKTCETCQRTKVNFAHRYAPLHPVPVPDELGHRFAMDHKIPTRTTDDGNTAVLVIVEHFSGYPHLIPVKNTTAEVTARAIVDNVIPIWGVFNQSVSDKRPSFTSQLFANINNFLGNRHTITASLSSKSNGQAESVVKRLVEHLQIYAKDDLSIEEKIPMIEIALRATPHSKLLLSFYEIVFGRPMPLGIPGEPQPRLSDTKSDNLAYYRWLTTKFKKDYTQPLKSRAKK